MPRLGRPGKWPRSPLPGNAPSRRRVRGSVCGPPRRPPPRRAPLRRRLPRTAAPAVQAPPRPSSSHPNPPPSAPRERRPGAPVARVASARLRCAAQAPAGSCAEPRGCGLGTRRRGGSLAAAARPPGGGSRGNCGAGSRLQAARCTEGILTGNSKCTVLTR